MDHIPKITISTIVNTSLEKAWKIWTCPEDIKIWNTASPDWHTTKSEVDLKVNGKFCSRMEAKDGSFGFDFGGTYMNLELHKKITVLLDDGRSWEVFFEQTENGILVTEIFEAESENTLELQKNGWQAILDNFKNYAEN
jgi:uncharacterized protein YndB with AHSA1/START domain